MKQFNLTFDMVFKIGILMIGIALIYELHSFNQKGRYQPFDTEVLDTRTGVVYSGVGPAGTPGASAR